MINIQPVGVAFVDTFGVNTSDSIRAIDKGIKQVTEKKQHNKHYLGHVVKKKQVAQGQRSLT